MKRLIIGLVVCGLVFHILGISSLAGVNVKQIPLEETRYITFGNWGGLEWDPATVQILEDWEKEHPAIKVRVVPVPDTMANPKYMNMFLARSDAIDVFNYDQALVNQFARAGWLEPVDDLFTEDLIADCSEGFLKCAKIGDHYWYSPHFTKIAIINYRTDLLAEAGYASPPETWDELVEYGRKLTQDNDGDGVVDIWGFAYASSPLETFYNFRSWVYMAGGDVFDEAGNPVFNSEIGLKALQFLCDLRNDYKIVTPDVVVFEDEDAGMEFERGHVAMVLTDGEKIFRAMESELIKDVFNTTTVCTPERGMPPRAASKQCGHYMNVYSRKKEAVREFMRFFFRIQSQKHELIIEHNMPVRPSTFADPEVRKKVPNWKDLQRTLRYAQAYSYTAQSTLRDISAKWIGNALLGKISVQEALDNMEKDFREVLF